MYLWYTPDTRYYYCCCTWPGSHTKSRNYRSVQVTFVGLRRAAAATVAPSSMESVNSKHPMHESFKVRPKLVSGGVRLVTGRHWTRQGSSQHLKQSQRSLWERPHPTHHTDRVSFPTLTCRTMIYVLRCGSWCWTQVRRTKAKIVPAGYQVHNCVVHIIAGSRKKKKMCTHEESASRPSHHLNTIAPTWLPPPPVRLGLPNEPQHLTEATLRSSGNWVRGQIQELLRTAQSFI